MDLPSEANPPSFTKNRLSEKRNAALMDGNIALLNSDELVNPVAPKKRNTGKTKVRKDLTNSMYEDVERELKGRDDDDEEEEEEVEGGDNHAKTGVIVVHTQHVAIANGKRVELRLPESAMATERQAYVAKTSGVVPYNPLTSSIPGSAAVGGKSYAVQQAKIDIDTWSCTIPDDMVDELKGLVREEDEAKEKDKIFETLNADYLKKQKEKEAARVQSEADAAKKLEELKKQEKSEEDYRKITGGASSKKDSDGGEAGGKTKKKERKRKGIGTLDFQSVNLTDTADVQSAVMATLQTRRVSRKINYDAMSKLFVGRDTFAIGDEGGGEEMTCGGSGKKMKKRKVYEDKEDKDEGREGGGEELSDMDDSDSNDDAGVHF